MSLARRLKAERPDDGLTSLPLSVLGHLHRHGPMTPGDLAAAERVQPQTLTRTLMGLEASGFVWRQEHPEDGRKALLTLSAAGVDALRRDMAQRDAWLARALAQSLTKPERDLLGVAASLIDQVADVAES
jgi:DNA-binding MarR family transcriptional regulator